MAPKRSLAWEFYTKRSSEVATCNICRKDIRYWGSTGNLMDHVKRKHHTYLNLYSMVDSVENPDDPSTNANIGTNISCKNINKCATVSSDTEVNKQHASSVSFEKTRNLKSVNSLSNSSVNTLARPSTSASLVVTSTSTCISTFLSTSTPSSNNACPSVSSSTITSINSTIGSNYDSTSTSSIQNNCTRPSSIVPRKRSHQMTMTGTMKLTELSNQTIKKIDNLFVDAIAEGYLPFSLVENKKFVKFCSALDPRYKLPSRKTLTNKMVTDRHSELKDIIFSKLNNTQHVALTADCWTSASQEGYLSVTAHFVEEGNLMSAVLCTKEVIGHHTGEVISSNIKGVMQEWGISEKTFAIVTDNASTMRNVANRLKLKHVGCAAHTLNLAVEDVFEHPNLIILNELRSKCRSIVGFFKKSTVATSKLVECQQQLKKTVLKLKQEVATRWNSTYIMLNRLAKVKEELIMCLVYVNCEQSISVDDWAIMEDVIALLEPLFELTEEISGEKYCTSSIVVPLVRGCQEAIQTVSPKTTMGAELKLQLQTSLVKRMAPYEKEIGICAKATILDPRFKKWGFKRPDNATAAVNDLIDEMDVQHLHTIDGTVIDEGTVAETEIEEIEDTRKHKKIWRFFFDNKEQHARTNRTTSTAKEDMRIYLSQPLVDMKNSNNPIKYWQRYKDSHAVLSQTACKYLCVPATSVPSERIFSKAGLVISDNRNRLKAKTVDKMVFLNANAKFFD